MAEAEARADQALRDRVDMVRRFNRFYTRQIGLLQEVLLDSEFSLTEVRVLYELDARGQATATDLGGDLSLDPGYLSRLLRKFEDRALIRREPAPGDGRQNLIVLTEAGNEAFAELNSRSQDQISGLLGRLGISEQRELVRAMSTVERLLTSGHPAPSTYVIRPPESGDFGWIVHRHGILYAREQRWDERFEGLVATIVGDFVRNQNAATDRCWVADADGETVGSVFLTKQDEKTAQLRLLFVEPAARERGIATRLVKECLRFARRAGYEHVTLWTNDVLHSARALYEKAGFRLVESAPHEDFGPAVVGQFWSLDLAVSE